MQNGLSEKYILHVSDFHITGNDKDNEFAKAALDVLVQTLNSENIQIDYLLHSGDVIDGNTYDEIANSMGILELYTKNNHFDSSSFTDNGDSASVEIFNDRIEEIATHRFEIASKIVQELIRELNVSPGNIVFCCGNHDRLRLLGKDISPATCNDEREYTPTSNSERAIRPYQIFLKKIGARESQEDGIIRLRDMDVLVLNTNWDCPSGENNTYSIKNGCSCINCKNIETALSSGKNDRQVEHLPIILAHKPIYEICEKIRLPHKRYVKTPFMSYLRKFVGENGVYICGDKHTCSITGSVFHDIPHFFCGEPLIYKDEEPKNVEYNLLKIIGSQISMGRKVHLSYDGEKWRCVLAPFDDIVSQLYNTSKHSIIGKENSLKNIYANLFSREILQKWEGVAQTIYTGKYGSNEEKARFRFYYEQLNIMFGAICKYRMGGTEDITWDKLSEDKTWSDLSLITHNDGQNAPLDLFGYLGNLLNKKILERSEYVHAMGQVPTNLLNIRGEYGSGKTSFLKLAYLFFMYHYSTGQLKFIPAYFNLEDEKILNMAGASKPYHNVIDNVFGSFVNEVQTIANNEDMPVCYILDGLDEQDCWSFSSEDSVGRWLLDLLPKDTKTFYIMSFSQHRFPILKNTMPPRIYSDKSDIIYFNPVSVLSRNKYSDNALNDVTCNNHDLRFSKFVSSFLALKDYFAINHSNNDNSNNTEINDQYLNRILDNITSFRRLTVSPMFMTNNYDYITDINANPVCTASKTYQYYIDRQFEQCLYELGYNFVHYASNMAFLFSYRGYTYEQFIQLNGKDDLEDLHVQREICKYHERIYPTFLFIKKNHDAREYLIALHYNGELRYYAEHPTESIAKDSILNEFVGRNIAVMVRKLWNDTNKFIIVCHCLLHRENLSCCLLSMLMYCLSHMEMYFPIKENIYQGLKSRAQKSLKLALSAEAASWKIDGINDVHKLQLFLDMGLKHTLTLCETDLNKNLLELFSDQYFCIYNRQYQMLYYGDLSIWGEERKHPLIPGVDIVNKGHDFFNCFSYLYVKITSNTKYALREYDICTLWDLIRSRFCIEGSHYHRKARSDLKTFFSRKDYYDAAKSVLNQMLCIVDPNKNDKDNYLLFRTLQLSLLGIQHVYENYIHSDGLMDLTNAAKYENLCKGLSCDGIKKLYCRIDGKTPTDNEETDDELVNAILNDNL